MHFYGWYITIQCHLSVTGGQTEAARSQKEVREIKDFEVFAFAVYNALGIGHKNAQTRRELCQKLKCGDRTLRRAIELLRRDYAILSCDDGRGYYLPETTEEGREETKRWLMRQTSRVISIKTAQAGAMKFVGRKSRRKDVPGQLHMFSTGRVI